MSKLSILFLVYLIQLDFCFVFINIVSRLPYPFSFIIQFISYHFIFQSTFLSDFIIFLQVISYLSNLHLVSQLACPVNLPSFLFTWLFFYSICLLCFCFDYLIHSTSLLAYPIYFVTFLSEMFFVPCHHFVLLPALSSI